jgi:NitT/TauT family transport system permease protein
MFNPLPSIAVAARAVWFGLRRQCRLRAGSRRPVGGAQHPRRILAVSPTLRMVGGTTHSRVGYVARILIPAAFPSILTGLKIGWAFAWRTLIAAELVFGVSSGSGGLGWYIFERKNQLLIPDVFAGLLTVILFGLFVEHAIFRTIEARTVRRWGMQS